MRVLQSAKLIWKDLKVHPTALNLDVLRSGQAFRWRKSEDIWSGVLKKRLYVLKETPTTILFGLPENEAEDKAVIQDVTETLRDYFQLDRVSLVACYERWGKADANFKKKTVGLHGLVILRQDPWENLICFICTSNNNIARITQMVHKLCMFYGEKVATLDDVDYYSFPSLTALAQDSVEAKLRENGFGYRARYIAETAQQILREHPDEKEAWVTRLRDLPYNEAKDALMRFPGIGPKVADCICLMSLDKDQAIPVDTHVWQIAHRDYRFLTRSGAKSKTLTPKLYEAVGSHFRQIFGSYSGWAVNVLFTADLSSFKKRKEMLETTSTTASEVLTAVVKLEQDEHVEIKQEHTLHTSKRTRLSRSTRSSAVPVDSVMT